jgi:hypothetical protein
LILSHNSSICRSQIYPFYVYRHELRARYGVQLRELNVDHFMARTSGLPEQADIVLMQPWFELGEAGLERLLDAVERLCRPARLVFLDSYAPTDLRFARVLADRVAVYVKKHVLRNRSLYGKTTIGDTNLSDYFAQHFGLSLPPRTFEVPAGFLDKLVVGPSFATADYMLSAFAEGKLARNPGTIDIHARLAYEGSEWYAAMRRDAIAKVESIAGARIVAGRGANRSIYLDELARSRLCFSPFGYGEVAWRDFEAVMCGSLLIKPDVSHLETVPNIFVPGESYVPLRWDLSDLEPAVRRYLADHDERRRITENASRILHEYFRENRFVEQMAPLFA